MNKLFSAGATHTLLVPGWIGALGFIALSAPPLGVAASLSLFVGGVVLVPAVLMTAGPAILRRAALHG